MGKLIESLKQQRVIKCLKQVTLTDFVYWIAKAQEVKPMVLKRSWQKITLEPNDKNEAGDGECLLSLAQRLPISEIFAEEDIAE